MEKTHRQPTLLEGTMALIIIIIISSIIDKISKNKVNNRTKNEKVPTFHHYLKQNYVCSHPSLVIRTFSTKEITCYAMRSVKPYVTINTLKMIYTIPTFTL